MMTDFDIAVIGAGHAGCEAALAAARMGCRTLVCVINADTIGAMSCNPAIGGLAKGHLVKEIDALGGEMARNIDATGIQFRRLNTSKGPAVRSSRAQADRLLYRLRMKRVLENQPNLAIRQAVVDEILVADGRGLGETAGLVVEALGDGVTGLLVEADGLGVTPCRLGDVLGLGVVVVWDGDGFTGTTGRLVGDGRGEALADGVADGVTLAEGRPAAVTVLDGVAVGLGVAAWWWRRAARRLPTKGCALPPKCWPPPR